MRELAGRVAGDTVEICTVAGLDGVADAFEIVDVGPIPALGEAKHRVAFGVQTGERPRRSVAPSGQPPVLD